MGRSCLRLKRPLYTKPIPYDSFDHFSLFLPVFTSNTLRLLFFYPFVHLRFVQCFARCWNSFDLDVSLDKTPNQITSRSAALSYFQLYFARSTLYSMPSYWLFDCTDKILVSILYLRCANDGYSLDGNGEPREAVSWQKRCNRPARGPRNNPDPLCNCSTFTELKLPSASTWSSTKPRRPSAQRVKGSYSTVNNAVTDDSSFFRCPQTI